MLTVLSFFVCDCGLYLRIHVCVTRYQVGLIVHVCVFVPVYMPSVL